MNYKYVAQIAAGLKDVTCGVTYKILPTWGLISIACVCVCVSFSKNILTHWVGTPMVGVLQPEKLS